MSVIQKFPKTLKTYMLFANRRYGLSSTKRSPNSNKRFSSTYYGSGMEKPICCGAGQVEQPVHGENEIDKKLVVDRVTQARRQRMKSGTPKRFDEIHYNTCDSAYRTAEPKNLPASRSDQKNSNRQFNQISGCRLIIDTRRTNLRRF